jgi:hypothetical protein
LVRASSRAEPIQALRDWAAERTVSAD